MYKVLYSPGGCLGFLPSTAVQSPPKKDYPPGNDHISHQRGKGENLKKNIPWDTLGVDMLVPGRVCGTKNSKALEDDILSQHVFFSFHVI